MYPSISALLAMLVVVWDVGATGVCGNNCAVDFANGAECGWDFENNTCVDCSMMDASTCKHLDTLFLGHTNPCTFNQASQICQSTGFGPSIFDTEATCVAQGRVGLERFYWNATDALCQECTKFSVEDCPSPSCAVVAGQWCQSPARECGSTQLNSFASCNETDLSWNCFWRADVSACLWCGSIQDAALCNANSDCHYIESQKYCTRQQVRAASTPPTTPPPAGNGLETVPSSGQSSDNTAVIGAVIGSVATVGLAVGAVCFWLRGKRQSTVSPEDLEMNEVPSTHRSFGNPIALPIKPTTESEVRSIAVRATSDMEEQLPYAPLSLPQGSIARASHVELRVSQGAAPLTSSQRSLVSVASMSSSISEAIQGNRCQKMKLLGRGAFGSVYSCVLPDGSMIAMKEVLLPPDTENAIEPIMKEVQIVSSLDHPNVVKFYGVKVDKSENKMHIFMELVPTGSLASIVRSMEEPMEEELARVYVRQLVSAVAYIHTRGVVHRDLKCDNLLLMGDGIIKLTDFGASKLLGTAATQAAQTMVGTPFFMAPEVLSATEDDEEAATLGYGRRADVWSLGITILEMLERGKMPWPNFTSTAGALMHIATPGNLPVIPGRLSEQARDFISRCCTRDPTKRATSEELATHPWLNV